jgi:putative DNA primase/helicase
VQNGIEGWRTLVDQSLHAYEFLARTIIAKYKTSEEWTAVQLEAAIDDAIEFNRTTVNPERETDLDLFFWPTIRRATGVSEEALAARLEVVHNQKRAAKVGTDHSSDTTYRPNSRPHAQDAGCLVTRCVADIDAQPVRWLWPKRIARGKLSMLAGNPGLGKSQVTASIAAIVTTGGGWPVDHQACQQGDVLFLSAEDDPADTLRPRLEAAGADLRRVHVVDGVIAGYTGEGNRTSRTFCLQDDLNALEAKLKELGDVAVVVIDPISAYLGDTDSHKNAAIRGLLAPLSELAARYNVAIIAISHLSKAVGSQALMRVNGSLAFVAATRAAYLVAADPDDKERKLLLPLKNNLGPDVAGLAFRIEGTTVVSPAGPLETSRVMWESEPVLMTADEAMQATEGAPTSTGAMDEAKVWLRATLGKGPVAATQILVDAAAKGIAEKTLRRASAAISVQKAKPSMESGWIWSLP